MELTQNSEPRVSFTWAHCQCRKTALKSLNNAEEYRYLALYYTEFAVVSRKNFSVRGYGGFRLHVLPRVVFTNFFFVVVVIKTETSFTWKLFFHGWPSAPTMPDKSGIAIWIIMLKANFMC